MVLRLRWLLKWLATWVVDRPCESKWRAMGRSSWTKDMDLDCLACRPCLDRVDMLGLPSLEPRCLARCRPCLVSSDMEIFLGLDSWWTLSWHSWHRGMVFLPPRDWGTTWWYTMLLIELHSKHLDTVLLVFI